VTAAPEVTFEGFLQVLNLPIFAGMIYIVFRAGAVARQLDDIERRLAHLESWQAGRRSLLRNGDRPTV